MAKDAYLSTRGLQKKRIFFKLKLFGGLIILIALLGGIFYLVVYSDFLKIKEVEADNNWNFLVQDLKDYFVKKSMVSSFLGADNIIVWNNDVKDFLKRYPVISEINIDKNYLSRKIKIEIKEKERFGIWCVSGEEFVIPENMSSSSSSTVEFLSPEECWWFDKRGFIFEKSPSVEGVLINKVEDFSDRSLEIGDNVLKENALSNMVKIFEILDNMGFKNKSAKLNNIQFQEVVIDPKTSLKPKIYFSLRIDPYSYSSVIESLKKIGLEKIEYIDLRMENRAYYKMR